MTSLPAWPSALAILAHPDDESFGLGAVVSTLADRGTRVSVLCFTRGEASTLHGVSGDLAEIRRDELRRAADELGLDRVRLLAYPDGGLADQPMEAVLADARASAAEVSPAALVAFDPSGITGHPDHIAATRIAVELGRGLGLDVLGWTLPRAVADRLRDELGIGFLGHGPDDIDVVLDVDRTAQRRAIACHASQAVPGSPLWRRLELLGPREHLRWLHRPASTRSAG